MAGNEFLLPNELGWECADKVSARIAQSFEHFAKYVLTAESKNEAEIKWSVLRAECADDVYAIIKQHQEAKK